MSEDTFKIGGITGGFFYFAYGLAYFAFISALVLGAQGFLSETSVLTNVTNIIISVFNEMGNKALYVAGAIFAFVAFITGILLNDMAKKFSVISTVLLAIVSMFAIVVANIMINN